MRLSYCSFLTILGLALAGCDLAPKLAGYPAGTSPEVAAAPWPKLVDIPAPVAARASAPNPVTGQAVIADLSAEAARSAEEAEIAAEPVFEVKRLRAEAEAVRRGR